jgi:hypothetical protein
LGTLVPFVPVATVLVAWLIQPWGRAGEIVCFALAIVALLAAAVWLKRVGEARAEREAEKIKELISRKRHDWMNHVQVLMGYLSLGKQDRMRAYLQKLVDAAGRERAVSEFGYAPLAVALLTLKETFGDWEVDVGVDAGFRLSGERSERLLYGLLSSVCPLVENVARRHGEMFRISFRLYRDEKGPALSVRWWSATGEALTVPLSDRERKRFHRQVKKWNGQDFWIRGSTELLIRFDDR